MAHPRYSTYRPHWQNLRYVAVHNATWMLEFIDFNAYVPCTGWVKNSPLASVADFWEVGGNFNIEFYTFIYSVYMTT